MFEENISRWGGGIVIDAPLVVVSEFLGNKRGQKERQL